MTTLQDTAPRPAYPGWFNRSEAWLDSKGKGAWIAFMILGFIFFWPIGLAVLAYMIWSKQMFRNGCSSRRKSNWAHHAASTLKPTGNSAFDAYKADTLARLEQEQKDFESFLIRLREAKDKSEFDQFMADRARAAREGESEGETPPETDPRPREV